MAAHVFVGNVPWKWKEDDLRAVMAEAGAIVAARVVVEPRSRRALGYAFVEYASTDEAAAAVRTLHGREADGRVLRVVFAKSRPRQAAPRGTTKAEAAARVRARMAVHAYLVDAPRDHPAGACGGPQLSLAKTAAVVDRALRVYRGPLDVFDE